MFPSRRTDGAMDGLGRLTLTVLSQQDPTPVVTTVTSLRDPWAVQWSFFKSTSAYSTHIVRLPLPTGTLSAAGATKMRRQFMTVHRGVCESAPQTISAPHVWYGQHFSCRTPKMISIACVPRHSFSWRGPHVELAHARGPGRS